MKARDKILATTGLLRDNAGIGTPDLGADCWQSQGKAHGEQRMLPERNGGHLIALAWVITARRRGRKSSGPWAVDAGTCRRSDTSTVRTDTSEKGASHADR
jgi:hypothetical protein